MELEVAVRLIAGVVLIGANAFFVATEFALTRLRQIPRSEIGDDPGLRTAWKMTERLEIHLTGCQLGISLTSILLGIVAEPAVSRLLEPLTELMGLGPRTSSVVAVGVAVVTINLVHQIWGEQVPTYLGVERPTRVARRLAPFLKVWTTVLGPLIKLGDRAAKATLGLFGVEMTRSWTDGDDADEIDSRPALRREMGRLLTRGRVSEDRREEVLHALEIDEIPVRDIMIPAERVTALSTGADVDENYRRIGQTRHSRYPLQDDQTGDYVGVIYVPALFRHREALQDGSMTLSDIASPVIEVEADIPVSTLIDRLQDAAQEMALVVESDQVVGVVTVTDAFEEIAGEVEDPLD